MSISIAYEDGTLYEVATNRGWADFCRWVDTLRGSALQNLIHNGETEDPGTVSSHLRRHLSSAPNQDITHVAENLLEGIEGAEGKVTVTNGLS